MEFHEATKADSATRFQQDVSDVFTLFSLPRMEYHSREDTGFWESVGGSQFTDFYLRQFHLNFTNIVQTHFSNADGEMVELIDDVLGNYMSGPEEVSITFYRQSHRDPIGIRVRNEFDAVEHTATVRRSSGSPIITEDAVEEFDWLYGVYSMERTDAYGEVSFALTVSIRNTRDCVEFAAHGEDYSRSVREWVGESDDSSILPLSIHY